MASDEVSSSDEYDQDPIDETSGLSLDTVFEILASKRRRFVVYSLLEAPPGIRSFDDLVTDVAQIEADDTPTEGSGNLRKVIATDLHHWHLPVLEDIGILRYDERSEVIQYDGDPLLETWAEWASDEEFA